MTKPIHVWGSTVDQETRCIHYRSPLDIVALRFACCDRFYPCFQCHDDDADHLRKPWPADRFNEPAAMCGVCGHLMLVAEYQSAPSCPSCSAPFNPGCAAHAHLYFEQP